MVVYTIHKTSFSGVSTILSDDLIWDIILKCINTSILIVENSEISMIKPHEWYFNISPLVSMGPFLWAWHPISTATLVQCPPIAGNGEIQLLGHLPVYHFIGIIWQQYIHRSPRKSSETTSGWFLKVRSCLLVCSGIITLHYIALYGRPFCFRRIPT